jgi:probable HAF family extracellular repeat protein
MEAVVVPGLALGVSGDGSVIVGETFFPGGPGPGAYRWTRPTGPLAIGGLPGGGTATATGVSADGAVATGFAYSSEGVQAFRWTQAGGMVGLGFVGPASGFRESRARAISADGSTIVGISTGEPGSSGAFRWTQAAGMRDLGPLPAAFLSAEATAVSGDGSVIVGFANLGTSTRAFIWTAATGIRDLQTELNVHPAGWALTSATGISRDGSTIVGDGTGPNGARAWLIRIVPACYANCDGSTGAPVLNVSDFVCFQQRFAAGDLQANCDRSTATPVLNVNDFVCFSSAFAGGCP